MPKSTNTELIELRRINQNLTKELEETHRNLMSLIMELEYKLEESVTQLKEANKQLELFSYSVSHDLRSPLRTINGFSEILLKNYKKELGEKGQDYLYLIRDSTSHMENIIADLLSFALLSYKEMNFERVNITALAREIAQGLTELEQDRKVVFHIKEGMFIYGDKGLLRVMLQNLIDNAWKYTSKTKQAEITLSNLEADNTIFLIKDNGAGFDMAYAKKLFVTFQRLHSNVDFPGTGIGLASVKRIVQRHRGKIWAEGIVNQGATFYFYFPTTGLK